MSNGSINNISRVLEIRPVMMADSMTAKKELDALPGCVGNDHACGVRTPPTIRSSNKSGAGTESEMLTALMTLFNSFFTQLFNLMAKNKHQKIPDSPTPAPAPAPKVTPHVVPEVLPPTPEPAGSIPGLSDKRRGAKPDNIWSGFRQGPDGNCVTVSAIKAAMHRFGQSPTDIFKEVIKVSDGYRVVMRDGFMLTLTDRELTEGVRGAKFNGPDKGMLKDAQFLFAVSAKRAQMENNDRTAGRSYHAAIRSLNNGEDESGPGEGFMRLGLRKHMKTVAVRELARGQLGMCNRAGHSVAVIDGREELWGRRGSAPTRGNAVALV